MKEVTKIDIKSTNYDFAGSWTKEDIEQEMKEVDIVIESPSDWLDYLFDHVFGEDAIDEIKAACLPSVKSISFYVGDYFVKIEKTFA